MAALYAEQSRVIKKLAKGGDVKEWGREKAE